MLEGREETIHQYDYIVAGSGLAGLAVALRAARYGRVAVVTKSWVRESNSYYAQGGIAAVTDVQDTPALHRTDTLEAGRGLCDVPAVDILVNEAPARIRDLIEAGMRFDQVQGELSLGLEGGHHHRRILHAGGDATGALTTSFLAGQVASHPHIDIYENHTVLEILKRSGVCWGLRTWSTKENRECLLTSRHTFLALGGTGAVYQRTTNPSTTVGEGIAIAYNAGCEIADFEFIQFHPTALYIPGDPAFLISEAVRGEGAHLLNTRGVRFMYGNYPLAELEPRDTVARAIFRQIQDQPEPYVWLDLHHLDGDKLVKRFPTIYRHCKEKGLDLRDRIPIAPAAHYMVGGVRTNLYGQTCIPNLYVCGELANTGIMGANRLASNSLIECLVFGHRAVEQSLLTRPAPIPEDFQTRFHLNESNRLLYQNVRQKVAKILSDWVGIVRSGDSLKKAEVALSILEQELILDSNEYHNHNTQSILTVAHLLVQGAYYRKESRGVHFREDYPNPRQEFVCHTVQRKGIAPATEPILR